MKRKTTKKKLLIIKTNKTILKDQKLCSELWNLTSFVNNVFAIIGENILQVTFIRRSKKESCFYIIFLLKNIMKV